MPVMVPMEHKRFGRWVVLELSRSDRRRRVYWKCRCDCGTEREVGGTNLRSGTTKSCGCYNADASRRRMTTHGGTGTAMFSTWKSMLSRCHNPMVLSYEDYGKRGITVCERWHKFENFLSDMKERPSPDHSLDRIDNNAGYGPENCRWATRSEQMSNRRGCIYLDTPIGRLTVAAAARAAGVSWGTMRNRVKRNISHEAILDRRSRA